MIVLFAVQLGWLPTGGIETIGGRLHGLRGSCGTSPAHLVMPLVTLSLFYSRSTRG